MREAFKDMPPGEFRPCAFYDERLDAILIVVRDCSHVEESPREGICLMVDNYPEADQTKEIGFIIYGAKSFCEHHRLVDDGKVNLHKLFVRIALRFADLPHAVLNVSNHFPNAASDTIALS